MSPQRIQRRRTKGWRMPERAVYVGRPTKWGNPFTAAGAIEAGYAETLTEGRAEATRVYRQWLSEYGEWVAASDERKRQRSWIRARVSNLAGKDLACWCPEGEPCHADVLLELANPAGGER